MPPQKKSPPKADWQETQRFRTIHRGSERGFAWVLAAVLLIVAWFNPEPRWWLVAAAVVTVLAGLLAPRIFTPFNKVWHAVGMALGRIMTPVIMCVVFVVAIVPTGLLLRLFGKDVLRTKRRAAKTYWIKREQKDSSFTQQF